MKNIKYIFWISFSIAFGVFLSFLFLEKINFNDSKEESLTLANVLDSFSQKPKEEIPKYYLTKKPVQKLKINALAYLVGDLDTGEIILAQRENEIFPIASVSKLMTAYVAQELNEKDEFALVSKKAVATYGENGNFRPGEKVKVSDLLYSLLLQSSNDAAEILAEHFDRDTFLRKMNQVTEILELPNTSFDDPSGLSSENKSTAFELFKLAAYLKNKENNIFEITRERNYSTRNHHWPSNNQFLKKEGYLGGKSGYTDLAKQTVVSLFSLPLSQSAPRNIGIVLLQSKDRYRDVLDILSYLEKNIYYGGKEDAKLAWVKEKAGIPDIKNRDFMTFLFTGDVMLDRGVRSSVLKNFNGDYASFFEKIEIFYNVDADVIFANLEGPASDKGKDRKNLYSFRMDPVVIPALSGAGINLVSVANNHAGDWGREAFLDTLKNLEENEIAYIGGGKTKKETEEPIIFEDYGMKVGFLGFSDVGPDWMTATETETGILLTKDPNFSKIIEEASQKVDYLIVSFHFGDEYKTTHNIRQEYLAHRAIDAGAKIIIGHHPHVIQDIEYYKDGLIVYSLGNFIFDQGFSEDTMKGMLLELKLTRDGSITFKKHISKQNKQFQPEKLIFGKEEKLKR